MPKVLYCSCTYCLDNKCCVLSFVAFMICSCTGLLSAVYTISSAVYVLCFSTILQAHDNWEAVRILDDAENWAERNEVLFKEDHTELVHFAKVNYNNYIITVFPLILFTLESFPHCLLGLS